MLPDVLLRTRRKQYNPAIAASPQAEEAPQIWGDTICVDERVSSKLTIEADISPVVEVEEVFSNCLKERLFVRHASMEA